MKKETLTQLSEEATEELGLLELNIILKALRKSALEAKPFSEEGIKTVRLAEKVVKIMQSIINTFPEDIQKVIWKESEAA